jgi:hypothetical protein
MPKKTSAKLTSVRKVYGKPWSRMAEIEVSPEVLQKVGDIIVESIREEALKDYAKDGRTPRGLPMGLPNTDRFWDSFSASLLGASTVIISSSWPWINRHIEGRKPFKMWWITQDRGRYYVPLRQPDGSVNVAIAPLNKEEAWVHPGVIKYHFINRGVKKGRKKAMKLLAQEVLKKLVAGNFLK